MKSFLKKVAKKFGGFKNYIYLCISKPIKGIDYEKILYFK